VQESENPNVPVAGHCKRGPLAEWRYHGDVKEEPRTPLKGHLVILDCDGVLIDSESISVAVELEELRRHGCSIGYREYLEMTLGRTEEEDIWRHIASASGVALPSGFADRLRDKVRQAFEQELKPIPGVESALKALHFPKCVASGSRPERLSRNLELTGLSRFFDGAIFSATMVARGKPYPDLFLHAADVMRVRPKNCVVVEDSPAGVTAGQRAGMAVLAFVGASHSLPHQSNLLREMGCQVVFDDITELPELCRRIFS
jgi:HAD superfamily hydrolase (TIGR01509 family)